MIYKPSVALTPAQKKIWNSKARFKIVKAGRRFGKTKFGVRWTIDQAIRVPNELHWYTAPTYRMASEIAWTEFLAQIPPDLITKKNENKLWIRLVNDAIIQLKGTEDPKKLRGRRLGSFNQDEAAFQRPEVFASVIRPMLADLEAPSLMTSSPKKGWFSTAFEAAKNERDWEAFHFTIYDNPLISREEIEKIKATTPSDIWRREYMAEEIDSQGQVYDEFRDACIYSPSQKFVGVNKYPCVVGVDWGWDDPTGAAWLHINPDGHVIVAKEHLRSNWDVAKHSDAIKAISKGRNTSAGNYVLDRANFRVEGGRSSIADQFKDSFGFLFQRSEKDFNYGLDIVKRFLRGDGKTPWLHISESCPETIRAFREWEHSEHEPDVLAAIRYALVHAVKNRLTTIVESFKSEAISMPDYAPKGYNLPLKRSKKDSWSWDYSAGVPC